MLHYLDTDWELFLSNKVLQYLFSYTSSRVAFILKVPTLVCFLTSFLLLGLLDYIKSVHAHLCSLVSILAFLACTPVPDCLPFLETSSLTMLFMSVTSWTYSFVCCIGQWLYSSFTQEQFQSVFFLIRALFSGVCCNLILMCHESYAACFVICFKAKTLMLHWLLSIFFWSLLVDLQLSIPDLAHYHSHHLFLAPQTLSVSPADWSLTNCSCQWLFVF